MSQKNVDLTHRAYEALQRGDIEGFIGYFDPDVEFSSLVLEMEGTFHGHEGMRTWWAAITDAFPDWYPRIVEVRDLDDWVLIHARGQGRGAGSGVGVDEDFWQAVQLREGRVVRYAAVRTEAEALEAVGPSQ